MPDFAMCKGDGCKARDECRRFVSTPNPGRQSWIKPNPEKCEFFWAASTRKKEIVTEIFDKLGEKK